MALYLAIGILLVCYLFGGIGFYLLVWSRERGARVAGVMMLLISLTIRLVFITPALVRIMLG
jgi:membrane protein implicated in regulation of membrane protease activity